MSAHSFATGSMFETSRYLACFLGRITLDASLCQTTEWYSLAWHTSSVELTLLDSRTLDCTLHRFAHLITFYTSQCSPHVFDKFKCFLKRLQNVLIFGLRTNDNMIYHQAHSFIKISKVEKTLKTLYLFTYLLYISIWYNNMLAYHENDFLLLSVNRQNWFWCTFAYETDTPLAERAPLGYLFEKYFMTFIKSALLFPFSLSLWLVPLKQSCGQCPKLTLLLHTTSKCQLASSPSLSIRGYSEEFFFKRRHMFISNAYI